MRNISGKRILSLLLVLAMLVGMVVVPTSAAAGTGTEADPIIVYRNPELDPAGDNMLAYTDFDVRPEVFNLWKEEILSEAGYTGNDGIDIRYFIRHQFFNNYYSFDTNLLQKKAGYWFGWGIVANPLTDSQVEKVKLFDSNDNALTGDLYVKVQGYVNVKFVDGLGQTIGEPQKVVIGQAPTIPTTVNSYSDDTALYTFNNTWSPAVGNLDVAEAAANTVENGANKGYVVYTAQYDKKHTVTFDTDGGSTVESQTVATNGTATDPGAPTKTGYIFGGWYADEAYTNKFDFTAGITTNTTVYAKWDDITLTFDSVGGSAVPAQVVGEDGVVTAPDAPTKTGHDFIGWYKDTEYTAEFTFGTLTEDTTVYAKWEAQTYTVKWYDENATEPLYTNTVKFNKTPSIPAANEPSKDGYTLVWSPVPAQITEEPANGIIEYRATYTSLPTYQIKWVDDEGNEYKTTEVVEGTVPSFGGTPTKNETAEYIYKFANWTPALEAAGENAPTEYKASFTRTKKSYTITWVDEDGKTILDQQTLEYGSTPVYAGDTPDKDDTAELDYSFAGWENDVATVTGKATIKATYSSTKQSYKITWVDEDGKTILDQQTLEYGSTPVYAGDTPKKATDDKYVYTFERWDPAYVPVAGTATYKAVYSKEDKPLLNTTIAANATATVIYGYEVAALENAIAAVVTDENGATVQGAKITYSPSIAKLSAGVHTVTASYAGDNTVYAAASNTATVKVVVNKAAAPEVTVKSQTIKYGQEFEHEDPISTTPDVTTIDFVAGLDVHDETNLLGLVQVGFAMREEVKIGIEAMFNCDLENLTYDQFVAIMGYVAKNLDGVGALIDGVDGAAVEKLINALQTYKDSLPVDTEIRISVVDAITLPTNVGVYLVGAVTADNNYETALGAGYLVITPNGMKVELSWNYNDENGILTIPAFKTGAFDLTAKATLIDSTLEGADGTAAEASEHLEYIYIGVDADGELILSRTLDLNSRAGVYAEVAYIANWDNAMYYAVPIARTLLLAPGVADVAFIDVNGNKNYAQAFEYDGQPKPMTVYVNDKPEYKGTLTVKYIGIDGHADGYNRTDAPTEAGLYAVVATYTEYVDGKLEIVGGAVGALMIEQVEPGQFAFEKEHTLVEFDGQTHFPTILSNLSYDYVTLAIDRDTNTVYVTLPDDVNDHIAKLPEEVQAKIAELTAMVKDGNVKTETVKTALNDAIDQLIAINMEAKATEVINKVIDEVTAEFNTRIDVDALKAKLNAEINTLKQSVKDKLPEEIASMLEQYITVNTDKVDVDVEGLKAELKAVVAKLEGILPAEAVEELKLLVEKVVGVVNGNAQVNEIKTTVQQILDKLETLEVPDAETLVKLLVGAAVNKVDAEQLKTVINAVVDKVKSQEVLDEAVALVKDVAAIYGGKIDTSAVEATVKALIEKIKAKAESGQLDDNDLANLEVEVDKVFASLKDIVNQVPDATIVAGNPSKVGKYDCYALNISANYKPTLIESKMTIYNPGTITLTPKSLETMYSGVEQSVSGFNKMTINGTEINVAGLTTVEFTMGNAVYTLDLSGVSASAKGTNAGEYAVVVTGTPVVKNAKGEDVTAQFTVEYDTTTTLTITKRNVKLTSATASKKFDGKPLTASTVKVEGDGFADGQGIEYVVTGTQTAVGSSENKFTYTFTGTDEQKANYIFTIVLGTLTVTLDDLTTITVEANSGEFEYDGAAKTVEGFKTLTFGINGKTYTVSGISAKATATDAGTYEVKIEGTPVVSDADGVNVTAMFEVLLVNGKLTITAAAKEEVLPPMIPTAAIVVSANEGGFVSNIGRNIVVFGTEHTFNVKPNAGYVIADVLVNGVSVGAIDTVTVRARTRVTTIDVVFAAAPQFPFTDVAPTEWYYDDVKYVWEQGLMNGTAGDAFSPLASTTRAMIVTILWRLEGSPVMESAADFFDVEANVWYSQAISWASANGIVNGYGNGLFGPMDNITREQVAAIFCRYAAYKGIDTTAKAELGKDIKYTPWAADVLGWAEAVDLYDVVDRDTNDRTAAADRAEIAAYLRCLCEIVK